MAPVGLALLATGILYFLTVGKWLLPDHKIESSGAARLTKTYFADTYGIEGDVYELLVTVDSPLVGMQVGDAEQLEGTATARHPQYGRTTHGARLPMR